MNTALDTACDSQDAAMTWIAKHGEIDDVVILDAACAIVLNLYRVHMDQPACEMRKLHGLVELPQSTVLRAVKHLNQAGVLASTEKLHDPLGVFVSLPDHIVAKLDDLEVPV